MIKLSRRMMKKASMTFCSLSDDESWGLEKVKSALKEKEIRELIFTLSNEKLALRKVGVGVEGENVSAEEKGFARKILDYVIWNVEQGKLIALADIVSTNYDFKGSKFFPVALWKKEVMNINDVPTALVYELEKENSELRERIWWYVGHDIKGGIIKEMPTKHRGRIIKQDVVTSDPNLWTRGIEHLIKKLLSVRLVPLSKRLYA